MNRLYCINIRRGPHEICAGIVTDGKWVVDAADVFRWMIGKLYYSCERWIIGKRGRIDFVGYCA